MSHLNNIGDVMQEAIIPVGNGTVVVGLEGLQILEAVLCLADTGRLWAL